MSRNPKTPLSPNEEEALTLLEERLVEDEETLSHEAAVEHLVDGGFEREVAGNLIDRLLSKGYLYQAEAGLRITNGP